MGAEYNKKRLKGKKYFTDLLDTLKETPLSVTQMLRLSRQGRDFFQNLQKGIKEQLLKHPLLQKRVELLMSVPGVGEVTALTWALEVGEPSRFSSIAKAISYCGLCSAQNSSAGKESRGPISKQRNKHLQSTLIEAAKMAPLFSEELRELREKELLRGNKNRATLAVARQMVAWLLSVDKSGKAFELREKSKQVA